MKRRMKYPCHFFFAKKIQAFYCNRKFLNFFYILKDMLYYFMQTGDSEKSRVSPILANISLSFKSSKFL